jgi:hypothetical protein
MSNPGSAHTFFCLCPPNFQLLTWHSFEQYVASLHLPQEKRPPFSEFLHIQFAQRWLEDMITGQLASFLWKFPAGHMVQALKSRAARAFMFL